MSTTTTNLGLVKPGYSDPVDISVINGNMDALDEFAGNVLSSDLGTKTVAELETALVSLISGMGNGEYKRITVTISASAKAFINTTYSGELIRITSSRCYVFLYRANAVHPIIGLYFNDWTWDILAVESHLAIMANGSTAPQNISTGQYVYWNGGLYVAKTSIASGASVGTSNLTAVTDGGLNSLGTAMGNKVSNSMYGIVTVDGKAPSVISTGQYMMHQGVLRVARANIASGETITSSNSAAVTGGGLNSLNSDFNTLNTAIATVNLGSLTVPQMQTALETMGSSMADNEHRYFRFYCSAVSAPFGGSVAHIGQFLKYSSGRYCAIVQGADSPGRFITGVYTSNGWSWTTSSSIKKVSYTMETAASEFRLDNKGIGVTVANLVRAIVTNANNVLCIPYTYSGLPYIRFVKAPDMTVVTGTYALDIMYYA